MRNQVLLWNAYIKRIIFFLFKLVKIFLTILLNLIKQFDFKTYQPDSLSISNFKLNCMKVNSK